MREKVVRSIKLNKKLGRLARITRILTKTNLEDNQY
jgi:hypothetical protein